MADFTTLASVKSWLGITTSTDDAALTSLITNTSQYIRSYLSRDLDVATYSEVRNGTGSKTILVNNFPVQSVSSVTASSISVPMSDGTSSGFYFDSTTIYLIDYGVFPMGQMNVKLVYTAGYPSIPTDISQACTELVAFRWRERSRIGEMSRKTSDEQVIRFHTEALPNSVKVILNQYRRVMNV